MKKIIFLAFILLIFSQFIFAQPPQVRKKVQTLPPKFIYHNGFYTGKDWLLKIGEKEETFLYLNGKKQGICTNLEDVSPENSLSRTVVATEKMPQTGYQTSIYFGANKKWENLPFSQVKIYFDAQDTIVECWKNAKYLQETRFLDGKIITSDDSLHQRKVILNNSGKGYFVWLTDNQKVWDEKKETKFPFSTAQTATASEDGKNWIWAAQEGTILSIYFNGNKVFSLPSFGKDSLAVERIILAPDGKEYALQAKYPYSGKNYLFFSNHKIKELGENIVENSLCYGVFYPKNWSWLSYQNGENAFVGVYHSAQKTDTFPPYISDVRNKNAPHFIWDSNRKKCILTYSKSDEDVPLNYFFYWKEGKIQRADSKVVFKMDFTEKGNLYSLETQKQQSATLILRSNKIQMSSVIKNQHLIFTPSENFWWTAASEWFDELPNSNVNIRTEIHYEVAQKKAFWLEWNEKGDIFLCERELP